MTTDEINTRFAELEAMCVEDDRHDYDEQLRQWIYAAEARAEAAEKSRAEIEANYSYVLVGMFDAAAAESGVSAADYFTAMRDERDSAEQRLAAVLEMLKPGESPVMYGTHSDDYTPAWRRHRDLSDLHRRTVEIAEGKP